jgi:hypothetical protein
VNLVTGIAGHDVGIDRGSQVGAVQVQVEGDLCPLHLEDLGIGLHLLRQCVDGGLVGGRLDSGADLRLSRAQGIDQHVVGILIMLLAFKIGSLLQRLLGFPRAARREHQRGA